MPCESLVSFLSTLIVADIFKLFSPVKPAHSVGKNDSGDLICVEDIAVAVEYSDPNGKLRFDTI